MKVKVLLNRKATKIVYVAIVVVSVLLNTAILALNNSPATLTVAEYFDYFHCYTDPNQYAYLADSFLHGRLYLDLPIAPEFAALDNPYSFDDRYDIGGPDTLIYWDYAFYNGKYYSYFGAAPAILLYAPYQLLTGQYLPTPYAVAYIAALAIIALGLLTWRIARRYFDETATLGTLSIAYITMFLVCNFSYLTFVARFYSVPILFSIFFTCLGLWFWLGVRREDAGSAKLSTGRLIAGSICIALNIGCRPLFILFAVLAFFIFKQEIFHERLLFSRAGLGQTIAAILPFLVIGGLQMAYNYARFGSILDFGSSRNLTGFDMTEYNQRILQTILLFSFYLFQPLNIIGKFPFIAEVNDYMPNLDWYPSEPYFGGIFMLIPILFLIFALPFAWKTLRKRDDNWSWALVICVLLGCGILVLDIRIAGITERYFSDFAIFFGLVAIFVMFALWERLSSGGRKGGGATSQLGSDQGDPPDRHDTLPQRSLKTQRASSETSRRIRRNQRIFLAAMWVLTIFAVIVCVLRLFSPAHYDCIALYNPGLWDQICTFWGV